MKKVKKRVAAAFLATATMCSMVLNASAYTTTTSWWSSWSVNNKTYDGRSETRAYSSYVIGVCVIEAGSGTFSSKEVGGKPSVYDSSGSLVASANWSYCSSGDYYVEFPKTYYANSGSYYTVSNAKIWQNSTSQYVTKKTATTPNATIS